MKVLTPATCDRNFNQAETLNIPPLTFLYLDCLTKFLERQITYKRDCLYKNIYIKPKKSCEVSHELQLPLTSHCLLTE